MKLTTIIAVAAVALIALTSVGHTQTTPAAPQSAKSPSVQQPTKQPATKQPAHSGANAGRTRRESGRHRAAGRQKTCHAASPARLIRTASRRTASHRPDQRRACSLRPAAIDGRSAVDSIGACSRHLDGALAPHATHVAAGRREHRDGAEQRPRGGAFLDEQLRSSCEHLEPRPPPHRSIGVHIVERYRLLDSAVRAVDKERIPSGIHRLGPASGSDARPTPFPTRTTDSSHGEARRARLDYRSNPPTNWSVRNARSLP